MTGVLHDPFVTPVAPVSYPAHRKPEPVRTAWLAVNVAFNQVWPLIAAGAVAIVVLVPSAWLLMAAYIQEHGVIAAMQAGAVAVETIVIAPLGWWIAEWLCRRIDAKADRRHRAGLARRCLHAIRALPDVKVTTDRAFGVAECLMCDLDGLPAAVRVYGDPALRHQNPVELAEVCAIHALSVIQRALSEQDEQSRYPIRVEVAA